MFSLATAAAGVAVDLHRATIVATANLTGRPTKVDPLVANIANFFRAFTVALCSLLSKGNPRAILSH